MSVEHLYVFLVGNELIDVRYRLDVHPGSVNCEFAKLGGFFVLVLGRLPFSIIFSELGIAQFWVECDMK